MTINLQIANVITAISGITVTGLTVCDLDEIPNAVDMRTSYLLPSPVDPPPLTNFQIERASYGMETALADATYTLNYLLMYKPVGSERGLMDIYPGLIAMAVDVIEAIMRLSALNGAVDWTPRISNVGMFTDPSGIGWHACQIAVDVKEFIQ